MPASTSDTRLSIRVSPEELKEFKQQANDAGMTLADWVRLALLKRGSDVSNLSDELKDVKQRLKLIEATLKL